MPKLKMMSKRVKSKDSSMYNETSDPDWDYVERDKGKYVSTNYTIYKQGKWCGNTARSGLEPRYFDENYGEIKNEEKISNALPVSIKCGWR